MAKRLFILLFLTIFSFSVFAGDIATYINLGFSEDSKNFMFGQYGITEDENNPYAEIFTVDVRSNVFAPDGIQKAEYDINIQAGQIGMGALLNLLKSCGNAEKFGIDHTSPGRVVYLLVNGNDSKSTLEFRDFTTKSNYKVSLVQSVFNEGANVSSSFYIALTVTDAAGTVKPFTIGLPEFKRTGVRGYKIKQVLFSPDEKNLVFVVEKEKTTANGIDIRYMVETINLR